MYQKTTHRNVYGSENQRKKKDFLEKMLISIEKDMKKLKFKNIKIV